MNPRRATVADAVLVARVEAEGAHAPWSEAALRSTLQTPSAVAFVVGEPVVGHLLATAVSDEGEVLALTVSPTARRSGLGRALLTAAVQHWRSVGVRRVFLEVRADNAPAIALYASLGFAPVGRRPRYYADGVDAELMALHLPEAT